MPVNADWSAVRDWEQLHEDDNEAQLTEAFMTFGWGYGLFDLIGLSELTEQNIGEAWARLAVMQALTERGAFFSKWTGEESIPLPITRADLERRIGLKSNYSNLTRTAWQTKKFKVFMDVAVKK
jgi:hypothetical protein